VNSVQGVKDSTRAVAERLRSVEAEVEPEELRRLRNFCVSLSQSAQAHPFSQDEVRSRNKYRK
jgi:hypothetical protein